MILITQGKFRTEFALGGYDDLADDLTVDQRAEGVGRALHRKSVRDVRPHHALRRELRQDLDIVAPESPPSWAVGARLNPGPHQFHAEPDHFRTWARGRGHYFCQLSDVREIMRPVPIPGEKARWGLCDGLHREAHEFVPA